MSDSCPHCGVKHEAMYSDRVLQLYHELEQCDDPAERRGIMIEMAIEYTRSFDDTEMAETEAMHDLVAEVIQGQMAFERLALKLGRVVTEDLAETIGESGQELPPIAASTRGSQSN